MVIRRVKPLSVAKVMGIMYAALGLLIGAAFALIGSFAAVASRSTSSGVLALGAGLGLAAIVVFPICYGVIGFVFGLISAALYNLFAGMVGGVEIETT